MEKGWDATGRLAAFWGRAGGRDKLAELTGINKATLSGYNSGRLGLGYDNATKIATVLQVSLLELGAPAAQADDPGSRAALSLLAELSAEVERIADTLGHVLERLGKLESGRGTGSGSRARPRRATL
jgi:transcriptional regulator with XRE-family HTH domain